MRKMCLILSALFVLVPAVAQAQLSIGARTGYAIPMGDVGGTLAMSDIVSGHFPLQIDVDYRLNQLSFGGYFSYGVFGGVSGAFADTCSAFGESCSSNSLRVGAQLAWRFDQQPLAGVVGPWVGAGLGYERLTATEAGVDMDLTGFEFLIQGGHDWQVGQSGSLGLFASFSFGQYSDISVAGLSASIADKKMHEWLTLGVRGSFGFPK